MGAWGIGACASVAAMLAATLVPVVGAEHCETRIVMYGRSPFTPGLLLPPLPVGPACPNIGSTQARGHTLPPLTEQISVRVEVDVGLSYTQLLLRLDGHGFRHQLYQLHRIESATGPATYNLEDWLTIPAPGTTESGILATVRFPGGDEERVEYQLFSVDASPLTDATSIGQV